MSVSDIRYFVGRKPPVANAEYKIPYGAPVKVIRFLPRRRAIVEYEGEEITTFTYLLRKERHRMTYHRRGND